MSAASDDLSNLPADALLPLADIRIPLPQLCGDLLARFDMPQDDLLAARAQLKLTYKSIWHAVASGRLRTVRIRRAVYVLRPDADAYARRLGMTPRVADAAAPTEPARSAA